MLRVFVPRERASGETRVAATPETVQKMVGSGHSVVVETGAGAASSCSDPAYVEAGASIASETETLDQWRDANIVLTVSGPSLEQAGLMGKGALVVGLLSPHRNLDVVAQLRDGETSALAMELVPRISRAQGMDALSSQASIAGYKAVLLGAAGLDRYFPLLMTAAGTIKPAKVVIMGAGVAGLQAIATARRLGAVVSVSDIRDVVREQVESLGGRFIDLPDMGESGEGEGGYARQVTKEFLARQQEIVAGYVEKADVVITTALVPGRPAPRLVTEAMVQSMRDGAVIVDLAVEQGGNCELSERDTEVTRHGVRIMGFSNLPATMPTDASMLYARNVWALLQVAVSDGALKLDTNDEIIDGAMLVHAGQVRHERTADALRGES